MRLYPPTRDGPCGACESSLWTGGGGGVILSLSTSSPSLLQFTVSGTGGGMAVLTVAWGVCMARMEASLDWMLEAM